MASRAGGSYRIVFRGELGDQFEKSFVGMSLERGDGVTILTGKVTDQSQLMGLLEHGQSIGVELVSVEPVAGPDLEPLSTG